MGDLAQHRKTPILKAREARLQDLRCNRAVVRFSSAEMLTSRFAARSMDIWDMRGGSA